MKKKLGILFGGKSGEHEVSITSAFSIYQALDPLKYEIFLIGIDKTGRWVLFDPKKREDLLAKGFNPRNLDLSQEKKEIFMPPFESLDSSFWVLEGRGEPVLLKLDVIFPVLHGPFGEDGTMQGLLELKNIPYVGSGVLGSAVGMDKDVQRRLLKENGILVVKTEVISREDYEKDKKKLLENVFSKLKFPIFVKPARMGSSVGVSKIKSREDAFLCCEKAFLYDHKILLEEGIDARELECAVLGNENPIASKVGEIIPQHEFYSYEAKYLDEKGAILHAPAKNLSDVQERQIQELSIRAFKVLDCSGMTRVDFFLDKKTALLYLNEINTIPGFTSISMYPKLWQVSGKPYQKLLDELIELAFLRHEKKKLLKSTFD